MSELFAEIEDTAGTIRTALDAAVARAGEHVKLCQDLEAELAAADDDRERARLISRRCDAGLEVAYIASTLRGAMGGIALAARAEREPMREATRKLRQVA